jgi:hypothetical protein
VGTLPSTTAMWKNHTAAAARVWRSVVCIHRAFGEVVGMDSLLSTTASKLQTIKQQQQQQQGCGGVFV